MVKFDYDVTEQEIREVFGRHKDYSEIYAYGCYRRTGAGYGALNALGAIACAVLVYLFYILFAENGEGQNLVTAWVLIGIAALAAIYFILGLANGMSDTYYIFTDKFCAVKTRRQLMGRIYYNKLISFMRVREGRDHSVVTVFIPAMGERRVCCIEDRNAFLAVMVCKSGMKISN